MNPKLRENEIHMSWWFAGITIKGQVHSSYSGHDASRFVSEHVAKDQKSQLHANRRDRARWDMTEPWTNEPADMSRW